MITITTLGDLADRSERGALKGSHRIAFPFVIFRANGLLHGAGWSLDRTSVHVSCKRPAARMGRSYVGNKPEAWAVLWEKSDEPDEGTRTERFEAGMARALAVLRTKATGREARPCD